jgi:protein TonB
MFTVLLESRARRQRRTGGMALSIAGHVAIIGFATAATVHGRPSAKVATTPVILRFVRPPMPIPVTHEVRAATTAGGLPRTPAIPRIVIDVPNIAPPSLPPIDPGALPTPDDLVALTSSGAASPRGGGRGIWELATNPPSSYEWSVSEVMMHVLSSGKPRYPETLRQSGIDGQVLVQFVVDTLGRVDLRSVKVLRSTHELFTAAVRSALPQFRFKPAEVNGKRSAAMAQMPFEFQLNR